MRPGAVKSLLALARKLEQSRRTLEREVAARAGEELWRQRVVLEEVLEARQELDDAITRALALHDEETGARR